MEKPALLRLLTSAFGTGPPCRGVRIHGEFWRVSGLPPDTGIWHRARDRSMVSSLQLHGTSHGRVTWCPAHTEEKPNDPIPSTRRYCQPFDVKPLRRCSG